MRRSIFGGFLGIILTMSSCATLLNSDSTAVEIISNEPTRIIVEKDTLSHRGREHQITVERSGEPLPVTLYTEHVEKSISLSPQNSFAYWLNLYPNWHLWTGFLIDRKTAKRYTYP